MGTEDLSVGKPDGYDPGRNTVDDPLASASHSAKPRPETLWYIPPNPVDSGVPCRLATLGTPVGYTDCLLRALMRPRSAARPVPM